MLVPGENECAQDLSQREPCLPYCYARLQRWRKPQARPSRSMPPPLRIPFRISGSRCSVRAVPILSLRDSYRRDLREVKQITGFQYVRFHGILRRRSRRLRRGQGRQAGLQLLVRRSDLRRPAGQWREALRRAELHALQAGGAQRACIPSGTTRMSLRRRTTPSGTT